MMEPIKRRKLSEEVVDHLIHAISSGEYPAGAQFPSERELMLGLGVGRPVVREAMQKLEQMGFLRISHGERARVVNPTADDIVDHMSNAMVMLLSNSSQRLDDLKEARILMEKGLVRIATKKAGRADIDRLEKLNRELLASRGNVESFIAADMSFHVAIAEISNNQLFSAVMRGMLTWMTRFKRDLISVRGADKVTIAEHEKILKAMASGDQDSAAEAMADHLARASTLYSPFLGKRSVQI